MSFKNKEETNPKVRSLSSLKSLNVSKKGNNDKSRNSEKKVKILTHKNQMEYSL